MLSRVPYSVSFSRAGNYRLAAVQLSLFAADMKRPRSPQHNINLVGFWMSVNPLILTRSQAV